MCHVVCCFVFFFFQAEDGIRDLTVTGVQTCALPIALGLSLAGRSNCGWRIADCGLGTRSLGLSNPQSAIRPPQVASLTIGRLHYDGGGGWDNGPSQLVNLLCASRQRTRLARGDRER